jgi:hypothetical protein
MGADNLFVIMYTCNYTDIIHIYIYMYMKI